MTGIPTGLDLQRNVNAYEKYDIPAQHLGAALAPHMADYHGSRTLLNATIFALISVPTAYTKPTEFEWAITHHEDDEFEGFLDNVTCSSYSISEHQFNYTCDDEGDIYLGSVDLDAPDVLGIDYRTGMLYVGTMKEILDVLDIH